jgi:hypothetical protein
MRVASYAIIPVGIAGVFVGAYEAATGYRVPGTVVAALGAAAAVLAIFKLRRPQR